MSIVGGVGPTQGVPDWEEDIDTSDLSSARPASLLPDPETQLALSGDPGAMVAALTLKSAKDERDVARTEQRTEGQIQDREEAQQVEAMHEKASKIRLEAWTSGVGEAASGVMSLVSATQPASSAAARGWEAGAKLGKAAGDCGGKLYQADAAAQDAEAAAHEHGAGHARRAYDEATDDVKDARKLMEDALTFFREYQSSADQARAAATHRS